MTLSRSVLAPGSASLPAESPPASGNSSQSASAACRDSPGPPRGLRMFPAASWLACIFPTMNRCHLMVAVCMMCVCLCCMPTDYY